MPTEESTTSSEGLEVIKAGNQTDPTQALILLHGRGATAESILSVTESISLPNDLLTLAPQAPDHTWYPKRFIVPQSDNQPFLESALSHVNSLVTYLNNSYHLTTDTISLAGFSQGACLTAEYLKQNPQRYRAGVIWSGGLIGSDEEVKTDGGGTLLDTPIYLGCDESDFHIPRERVEVTGKYLELHSAQVTTKIYSHLGHTIHPEGLAFLEEMLNQ